MGARHKGSRVFIGVSLALSMLMVGPAASALASAKMRLVNARPGAHPVGLKVIVGGAAPPTIGEASFGQVTPYANVPAGSASIALSGLHSSDGNPAQVTEQLVDGARYTAVALAKGMKSFEVKVYRDGSARSGTARLRVLHAAPELGSPNVRLGQRTIAEKLAYRDATPYLSISPGSYVLAVVRPGGSSTPIFEGPVALSAGTATTAILAGTQGARERVIVATDDTKTPVGPPETGLGGLAGGGGPPWLLVALAALLAGTIGGVAQLSLARRSGRR